MVMNYGSCVQGFEPCENVTFNSSSFQARYDYEINLVPGYGCYLNMARTQNGSWGQLQINVTNEEDQKSLLLFDDDDETLIYRVTDYLVTYMRGMVYNDNGWLSKKVFIANRSDRNVATFTYAYIGAVRTKVAMVVMATSLLILSI